MAKDDWEKLFVFLYKKKKKKKTASLSLEETRGSKPGLCPTKVHGLLASTPHHHGRTIAPIPIAQMRRVRVSPGLPSSASLPIFV